MNNYYDFEITRTGFSKESEAFSKKGKALILVEKICSSKKIKFVFDSKIDMYSNKFIISATGTNYGIYLSYPHVRYEKFIFYNYIKNKKLNKILNINLKDEEYISKYNENTKHRFTKSINGVAVIPNQNKTKNLDFHKLNKFMEDDNNYIKIHPVTNDNFINKLVYNYGKEKFIQSKCDLTDVIKQSKTVAITSNTESMIPTSIYNKNVYFLGTDNLFKDETRSTYELFYLLLKNNISIQQAFEADLTGLIPWSLSDNEVYIKNKINKMEDIYGNWRNSIHNFTIQ